ncbi:MAG: aminotransferase class III-fold pyridoxal phosphate-dependent enzyme, partial [bacterium]
VKEKLLTIRKICDTYDIPLIFDEIITGCRVPNFTVANWYGIQPDLICMGKALAGGYPLSVLGGLKKIMSNRDVFVSYTFSGLPVALYRAIEVMHELDDVTLQDFWQRAGNFFDCFQ